MCAISIVNAVSILAASTPFARRDIVATIMCGIAGLVNWSGEPFDRQVLQRMIDIIRHRGPDAAGVHIDGPVGLAHARLSIIDLESGHQPMTNEDGTLLDYLQRRDLQLH